MDFEPSLYIAIDANVLAGTWGGIPKYVDRISRVLVERGDRVDLLVNRRRRDFDISGANEVAVRVKGQSIWRDAAVPLWAKLRKPDVYWAPAGLLPRLLSVPSVVTLHDLAPIMFPGSKSVRDESEFRRAVSRSARAADLVLTVSKATRDDSARLWGLDRARMRVVGNGVDAQFCPGDRHASLESVRAQFGLERPFVLAVGSLEPRKGLEVLIAAAAVERAEGASWQLVLAGSPGYASQSLIAAAERTGNCVSLGAVTDDGLIDLYRAAEAVAVPSIYEGFGITALESMACGTPVVIAGGTGGLEEVSGAAAVIVRERTPCAWRDGLEDAFVHRAELISAGIRHAQAFTWPTVAAATREVLAEAAWGRSPQLDHATWRSRSRELDT